MAKAQHEAPPPIDKEAQPATAGRSRQAKSGGKIHDLDVIRFSSAVDKLCKITAREQGAGSGPRLKPVNIVRMDSKANVALLDVKGLQFRRR